MFFLRKVLLLNYTEHLNTVSVFTSAVTDEVGGEKMAKKSKVKKAKFTEEACMGDEPQAVESAVVEAPAEAPTETPTAEAPVKVRKPTVLGSRGGGMYAKLQTYLTGLSDDAEVTKKSIEAELGAHSGYVQMCITKAVADGFMVKEGKAKFKVVHPVAS
jgi:hypothetical protein